MEANCHSRSSSSSSSSWRSRTIWLDQRRTSLTERAASR